MPKPKALRDLDDSTLREIVHESLSEVVLATVRSAESAHLADAVLELKDPEDSAALGNFIDEAAVRLRRANDQLTRANAAWQVILARNVDRKPKRK